MDKKKIHHNFGKKRTQEFKEEKSKCMKEFWSNPKNKEIILRRNLKISNKLKGVKKSKEQNLNNRKAQLGMTWDKKYGKEKSKELKEEYRKRFKKENPMIKRGGWNKEERKKLSNISKGRKPWNKGKKVLNKEKMNMDGLKKGRGWNKGLSTKSLIKCDECGKKRYIFPSTIKNSKSKRFFCSQECKKKGFNGEKNPNWLGNKSFEPYDKNFNNLFKRLIRKRDNQICMLCGIHREKLNRALHVHHINYIKKLTIPQNCISLCNSCHTKTGFNRKHWTTFFQSLLSERYKYNYSKEGEIKLEVLNND